MKITLKQINSMHWSELKTIVVNEWSVGDKMLSAALNEFCNAKLNTEKLTSPYACVLSPSRRKELRKEAKQYTIHGKKLLKVYKQRIKQK